jgi:hypothetical protein
VVITAAHYLVGIALSRGGRDALLLWYRRSRPKRVECLAAQAGLLYILQLGKTSVFGRELLLSPTKTTEGIRRRIAKQERGSVNPNQKSLASAFLHHPVGPGGLKGFVRIVTRLYPSVTVKHPADHLQQFLGLEGLDDNCFGMALKKFPGLRICG